MNKIKALIHPLETIASIVNSQSVKTNSLIRQALFEQRSLQLTEQSLHSTENGVSSESICGEEIIVSLTSHGKRINDVYLAIESIMQGSIKPNHIILWLSEEEINGEKLPISLQKQQLRGLEIEFCKDLRSYTKLIYTLQKHPNAIIITIDDDALYNFDFVENLVTAHNTDSTCIWANRIHEMTYNNNGTLKSYLQWNWAIDKDSIIKTNNFFTGIGGVLYPPHTLHEEVFKENIFMDICPTADDVWFNAMAKLKGTEIRKSFTHSPNGEDFLINTNLQTNCLWSINTAPKNCQNDIQIQAVFQKYGIK